MGDGAAILGVIPLWALTVLVFYLIIKAAVKNGVKRALEERDAAGRPIGTDGFTREG